MNKVILVVCLLALAVSGANTVLLLLMATKMKEAGDKAASVARELESVARELEQVPPKFKNLADKAGSNLPAKPPGPPGLKGQEAGEASKASDPEPKLPPKPSGVPLPLALPGK
jgi:hypothetical protein